MKIQPYKLSQVQVGDFSLAGYSVAGEETVIVAPEFDCVFDIGKCPREALTVNHVLLSHGHADHMAGITYYFAQRDFQGMEPGVAVVPERLVEPLKNLMQAWGKVEGQVPPHRFVGLKPGQDYEIRRGLVARAFASKHCPGALGFSVIDVRHKLKQDYMGLEGPELVELKNQGIEITDRIEVPQVAYLGDTGKSNYSDLPCIADAKALLIECTFFDEEHLYRAKAGRHLHVRDLPEVLEGMRNERIIIVHVTRRTNMGLASRLLKKTLPKETLERITFLMDRRRKETD